MVIKKISASLEDYLEAIYQNLQQKQSVKAITLSIQLQVSRASVTEALKKLALKELINYDRYGVISLTKLGTSTAKEIFSKHNLLFSFFKDILQLSFEEAQENACRVEHVISENAYIQFKKFMNKNTH